MGIFQLEQGNLAEFETHTKYEGKASDYFLGDIHGGIGKDIELISIGKTQFIDSGRPYYSVKSILKPRMRYFDARVYYRIDPVNEKVTTFSMVIKNLDRVLKSEVTNDLISQIIYDFEIRSQDRHRKAYSYEGFRAIVTPEDFKSNQEKIRFLKEYLKAILRVKRVSDLSDKGPEVVEFENTLTSELNAFIHETFFESRTPSKYEFGKALQYLLFTTTGNSLINEWLIVLSKKDSIFVDKSTSGKKKIRYKEITDFLNKLYFKSQQDSKYIQEVPYIKDGRIYTKIGFNRRFSIAAHLQTDIDASLVFRLMPLVKVYDKDGNPVIGPVSSYKFDNRYKYITNIETGVVALQEEIYGQSIIPEGYVSGIPDFNNNEFLGAQYFCDENGKYLISRWDYLNLDYRKDNSFLQYLNGRIFSTKDLFKVGSDTDVVGFDAIIVQEHVEGQSSNTLFQLNHVFYPALVDSASGYDFKPTLLEKPTITNLGDIMLSKNELDSLKGKPQTPQIRNFNENFDMVKGIVSQLQDINVETCGIHTQLLDYKKMIKRLHISDTELNLFGPKLKDSSISFTRSHKDLDSIFKRLGFKDGDLKTISGRDDVLNYNANRNFKRILNTFLKKFNAYNINNPLDDGIDRLIYRYKDDLSALPEFDMSGNNWKGLKTNEVKVAYYVHDLVQELIGNYAYWSILGGMFHAGVDDFGVYHHMFLDLPVETFVEICERVNLFIRYIDTPSRSEADSYTRIPGVRVNIFLDHLLGGVTLEAPLIAGGSLKFDIKPDIAMMDLFFENYRDSATISEILKLVTQFREACFPSPDDYRAEFADLVDISEDLRPLVYLIFKKLDIEIESSLRIAGKSDLTIINYYKEFYKLKFISRLNQRKGKKFNYHADLLDFFWGTASQLRLELHYSEYMHGRYIILTRSEINKLPSTVLTALTAYPRNQKKPTLLNAFSEADLNRLIGDKLDVSKNRLIQLMKDAITKCGSNIKYDIYGSSPSGYQRYKLPHLKTISQLSTDSELEVIAKYLLKEAFENNRLVVIGDEDGHFIYGFTKQGFLTLRQLFSVAQNGIYEYNKIYSNIFYPGPYGDLDLKSLTYWLNYDWVLIWGYPKSITPLEIWYDFWYYGDLFKPYFK